MDPPSTQRRGHRHVGQQLVKQGYSDASVNLPRGILRRGVPERPYFRGFHPGSRTSKHKTYQGTDLGTQFWCPIRTFRAHEGGFHGAPIPKRHSEIPERVRSTQVHHSIGAHQGSSLGRHLENLNFGPRKKTGGRRIPPNSDQEPISNPHQPVGGGQICNRRRAHEGGHGKSMFNQ